MHDQRCKRLALLRSPDRSAGLRPKTPLSALARTLVVLTVASCTSGGDEDIVALSHGSDVPSDVSELTDPPSEIPEAVDPRADAPADLPDDSGGDTPAPEDAGVPDRGEAAMDLAEERDDQLDFGVEDSGPEDLEVDAEDPPPSDEVADVADTRAEPPIEPGDMAISADATVDPGDPAADDDGISETTGDGDAPLADVTEPADEEPDTSSWPRILVFSRTLGYRHASIADGLEAIQALAEANELAVDHTEDSDDFNSDNLARYEAVVFLSTTGDVLDGAQEAAMEQFIEAGHGYVGVHSASDTEYDWVWYGGLVGAYFGGHPSIQTATVVVEDGENPATASLPSPWVRTDEWYNFVSSPRGDVHVLLSLDESTYEGGTMGDDHPIAWCREYHGGRAFYTALGHTEATYTETAFRAHLLGGVLWAAGLSAGDCGVGD